MSDRAEIRAVVSKVVHVLQELEPDPEFEIGLAPAHVLIMAMMRCSNYTTIVGQLDVQEVVQSAVPYPNPPSVR